MSKYKKIYFMGIKGVGMATLAIIAKQAGFIVGGSDIEEEFITDDVLKRQGIEPVVGFSEENVDEFVQGSPASEVLFIATGAHEGFDNTEVVYAQSKGIRVINHGQAVGLFMSGELFDREDIFGISVAGSHGKTTITSLFATVLSKLNKDPSFTAGTSEIIPIGAAGHYGKGKYFIAEADEYISEKNTDKQPKFYHQKPKALVVNNIDFDHPDFYKNIGEIEDAFVRYIEDLDNNTILLLNGDDERLRRVADKASKEKTVITYGSSDDCDFSVKDYKQSGLSSTYKVFTDGIELGEFSLLIPGLYNAKNSLPVIALLTELGFSQRDIAKGLREYKGSKRRFERVGDTKYGQIIFDDYAHHPEEIQKTITALKDAYKNSRLLTVFQAHTYSRTKSMEKEFISALSNSDDLIILTTFASLRHDTDNENYDEKFTRKFRELNKKAILLKDIEGVVEYINSNLKDPNLIILTMGAGDVYKVAYSLKSK